jgi:GH15 family glucan-1,4-alpha-glucosidase
MTDLDVSIAARPARASSGSLPIAEYALLSDCSSAALVGSDGSIDWLCLPRFDSPALFSRLLDPEAGHFSIAPTAPYTVTRAYVPGSLVLETTSRPTTASCA